MPGAVRWLAAMCVVACVGARADEVYRIVLSDERAEGTSTAPLRMAEGTYETRADAERALATFEQQGLKGWIAAEPRTPESIVPAIAETTAPIPVEPKTTPTVAEDTEAIAKRLATLAPESSTQTVAASRPLSLVAAVQLALVGNYELLAGAKRVASGAAQVSAARAELLPQLDVGVRGTQIDDDRAQAAFGREPERQSIGSLSLQQVLYSDDVSARYRVEQLLQVAREHEQEGRVLDTVLATSSAYLNLLRSEALLDIERENLKLSDSNFERARKRLQLGVANRAEVYRWQTTRANSQARVVNAEAATKRARIELNRTMNQPLGDQYVATTPTLDEPYFLVSTPAIRDALATPTARPRLREFFVEESLRGSPELKRLRSEIEAQQRRLTAANRSMYVPRFSATAGVDQELSRGGAGEEKIVFQTPNGEQFGEDTNDTEWHVGVHATLPIYQGGGQIADQKRAQADLDELQLHYDDAVIALRARVMQQAFAAEAAYDAIGYARTAADAGRKNLELIIEAYDRGAVPVIDVTDAQTSALVSEQNAANAMYDFLIDYMELQRSTGQFDLIATDADRDAMRQRLEDALTR
jgi:outer membrane protein TolC